MKSSVRKHGWWQRGTSGRVRSVGSLIAILLTLTVVGAAAATPNYFGAASTRPLADPIVDIVASPTGNGYWQVASDGGVFTFGDAHYFGSTGDLALAAPIVGMASTASGNGYWLVAGDGGVFAFGDATFAGSKGGQPLNRPIVGIASDPHGSGYWIVASDGGTFAFGGAPYAGSTGAVALRQPIVGMAANPQGPGYWLVASDGGTFAFGGAPYYGAAAGTPLASPIVGMAVNPTGPGYWLVAADGGVLPYGAPTFSSSGAGSPSGVVSGIAASAATPGYWLTTTTGGVYTYGIESRPLGAGMHLDSPLGSRESNVARDLFDRLNVERVARGLDPLVWDDRLAGAAASWSQHMASANVFAHQDLHAMVQDPSWNRQYTNIAENIYWGTASFARAGAAHAAFMNSPSHRENMLQPAVNTVGVGVSCGADGKLWVTEEFGVYRGWPAPGWAGGTPSQAPVARPQSDGATC